MGFRFKDKKDIKTFVLYLLMQVEKPIELETLNDIVVQDDYVNQFDFMDAFFELCQTGAVTSSKESGVTLYEISPKGRTAAEMLEGDLIGIIKERASCSAMRLLSFERRGAKAKSSIEEAGGRYMLTLEIIDIEGKSMELSLAIDSKRRAESMRRTFDEKPEFVYRALLGVLSGDINYLADSWADCSEEAINSL